jgi:hypothetical protein
MNRRTSSLAAAILTIATLPTAAQWLNVPTKGIPRTKDGKPDLSAPATRKPDGKLDLSGIWEPDKYYLDPSNLLQPPTTALNDLKPEDVVLTPEGKALRERQTARALDPEHSFGGARCTPLDLHQMSGIPGFPFKIVHSTEMFVFLYENLSTYRQIFMDGRQLPKDPNPTYRGYSVGRWDGDTLVVDTAGFHEGVLPGGRPHSEELHVTERFRRPDFGHLEIEFKFDDPKTYTKPWTFKEDEHLLPDTELLEYVCNENEKDVKHMVRWTLNWAVCTSA